MPVPSDDDTLVCGGFLKELAEEALVVEGNWRWGRYFGHGVQRLVPYL